MKRNQGNFHRFQTCNYLVFEQRREEQLLKEEHVLFEIAAVRKWVKTSD